MRELSAAGKRSIEEIAQRHGFSVEATRHMLDAVIRGNGSMAQFNHPEFTGAGQWMRGGMTMVLNMFDNDLKGWVDALCLELASLVASGSEIFKAGTPIPTGVAAPAFAPPPASRISRSGDWWPAGMGHPNSAGSQNGMRYAYFARARRLAIELGGAVTLYDTLDHQIGSVSQQQGPSGTLRFASQHGPVDVESLPVVAG